MKKTTWVRIGIGTWLLPCFAFGPACSSQNGSDQSGSDVASSQASAGTRNGSSSPHSGGSTQQSGTAFQQSSRASQAGAGSAKPSFAGARSIEHANSSGAAGAAPKTSVPCTEGEGEGCSCPKVSVALLGKPGQFGDKDSTALLTWLSSSSADTAKVDSYPERTTLTPAFLEQYQVLILLGLGEHSDQGPFWTYTAEEQRAVKDWVEQRGGGIIALSGASGQATEVDPNNQLIAFSQIAFVAGSWITPPCLNTTPDNVEQCSRCSGEAAPIADFNRTDPVVSNLANSVKWVGMHGGRSITAPADAHVVATIYTAGASHDVIVAKPVGAGRVLAFTDEWITYTSQWKSSNSDASCSGYLPQDVYQTAQFWYNMIRWVQPKATCFKLVDADQTVVLW